ncbi:hypothetical protein K435DRAFT_793551 [Dendrothele bispora CBS 962.96]|uniref:Uncharacterized protein n=1 Tax=Dendrothele bispora (strain CBS 962.96) TaxID=1314807 RepID=A0A4S8MG95_DENBC|nr:hypothetical protein K435DRAFT_793551 [Dendrothele bispora CBS 962.96]
MRSPVQNLVILVAAMQYEPVIQTSPDQEPKIVTTIVRDHDLSEMSKLLSSDYIGVTMITFLQHGYIKFTQPFFIQSLMGLKSLYNVSSVKMKRPWKAGGATRGSYEATSPTVIEFADSCNC